MTAEKKSQYDIVENGNKRMGMKKKKTYECNHLPWYSSMNPLKPFSSMNCSHLASKELMMRAKVPSMVGAGGRGLLEDVDETLAASKECNWEMDDVGRALRTLIPHPVETDH